MCLRIFLPWSDEILFLKTILKFRKINLNQGLLSQASKTPEILAYRQIKDKIPIHNRQCYLVPENWQTFCERWPFPSVHRVLPPVSLSSPLHSPGLPCTRAARSWLSSALVLELQRQFRVPKSYLLLPLISLSVCCLPRNRVGRGRDQLYFLQMTEIGCRILLLLWYWRPRKILELF